jgi:hypothetical protein
MKNNSRKLMPNHTVPEWKVFQKKTLRASNVQWEGAPIPPMPFRSNVLPSGFKITIKATKR